MYSPPYNQVEQRAAIIQFMRAHNFPLLVTGAGGALQGSHLPAAVQETVPLPPAPVTVIAVHVELQLLSSFDSGTTPFTSPAELLSAQARTYHVPADGKA